MTTVAAFSFPSARSSWRFREALRDLADGLARWELWSRLGWQDIRRRYRRSIVGPFWLTLSMGLVIGGLAYLYAGVFGQNLDNYLPYVALGMIVFALISTLVTDGSTVFIAAGPTILQMKAPLSIHLYQILWRNILMFAHNLVIYVLIVIFLHPLLGWHALLAIPGLVLVINNCFWVALVLGGLGARFRDVPPIVSSVMQMAFVLTPVFWTASAVPSREVFVHLNPFYYLIDIVRMPLMGETPPLSMWLIVIGFNCVSVIAAILFFARYRARIAYWV
jgi:ABC-2 type transport system permease protein